MQDAQDARLVSLPVAQWVASFFRLFFEKGSLQSQPAKEGCPFLAMATGHLVSLNQTA